ncbi:MAG TPA: tetratricopeptide repeat protein [Kiritimatiellia bacterium]|nr:tetratricopeptide repeat protein [Kiritimatiellia bacterium]HRZ12044.1 tetratricopeptide repeat protein [Kiritimatiellia bacterium]HSA19625.1 tetratricopeptide repeat protein [Kiritimatiellia bacterium]
MNPISSPPPDAEPGGTGGAAGYQYHRQRQNDPSRRGRDSRPAPRRDNRATSHAAWYTVLLVLASMGMFLLIVLFISRKTWQMKENARTRDIPDSASVTGAPVDLDRKRVETQELLSGVRRSDAELANEATLLARRGDLLQSAGQYVQAAEMYSEALRLWPDLNSARGELGRLNLRQREYNKALIVLQSAIGTEPDSPALLNDLAVAYFYQNRAAKAAELLEAALQYDPQFAPAHFNRALCFLLQSDAAAAAAELERYLAQAPGDPKALKEQAFLEASRSRYAEAYAIQAGALQKKPDWIPLIMDAAAVAALMGDMDKARAHLEHAAAKAPPSVVLQSFRGPAFAELRKTDAGRAFESELEKKDRARQLTGGDEAVAPWDAYSNEPLLSSSLSEKAPETAETE